MGRMSRLKSTAACPAAAPMRLKAMTFKEKKERNILGNEIICKVVNDWVKWDVMPGESLSRERQGELEAFSSPLLITSN
jgi:hypothetical protein